MPRAIQKTAKQADSLPMRDFAHSLPMALLRAREAAMSRFRPMLRDHGLTEQQWRVLRVLIEIPGGIEAAELADRCLLLSPSLTRILQHLESRRLIRRKVVAADQRRSAISITARGRSVFEQVAPHSEELYFDIEDAFGRKNLDSLLVMLQRLWESLPISRESR